MQKITNLLNWFATYKDGHSVILLYMGLIAAIGGGIWGFYTWTDQRERELMRPIFEQHIKTTNSIYEAIRNLDNALKNKELDAKIRELSSQFWHLYNGPAREFLTPESYERLNWISKHVVACTDKSYINPAVHCDFLRASLSSFADQARKDRNLLIKDGLIFLNQKAWLPRESQDIFGK